MLRIKFRTIYPMLKALVQEALKFGDSLPPVLIVVGSNLSGRSEVYKYIKGFPEVNADFADSFLIGLHEWFPVVSRRVGSVIGGDKVLSRTQEMLGEICATQPNTLTMFELNTDIEAYQFADIFDTLSAIFPHAVYIHVIQNPLTEYAEIITKIPDTDIYKFSCTWKEEVHRGIRMARIKPNNHFFISRNPHISVTGKTQAFEAGGFLSLQLRHNKNDVVIHTRSLEEIGTSIESIFQKLGLVNNSGEFTFRSTSGNKILNSVQEKDIIEICGWEMRLLRCVSVGRIMEYFPEMMELQVM